MMRPWGKETERTEVSNQFESIWGHKRKKKCPMGVQRGAHSQDTSPSRPPIHRDGRREERETVVKPDAVFVAQLGTPSWVNFLRFSSILHYVVVLCSSAEIPSRIFRIHGA
jgi:hypothetical protein